MHIKCDKCLDKGPLKYNGTGLESSGVFVVYLLSDDKVIDARYLSVEESINEAITHDVFAAFDLDALRAPYVFDEGNQLNSISKSSRNYQIANINSELTQIDYKISQTKIANFNFTENSSAFRLKLSYGNKKYKNGVDAKQYNGFFDVFVPVAHPVDAVIVVTPLNGAFLSQCQAIANEFIEGINITERNVSCKSFSALRDYHSVSNAFQKRKPNSNTCSAALHPYAFYFCVESLWKQRGNYFPAFAIQNASKITDYTSAPLWNLSSVEGYLYEREVASILGETELSTADFAVVSPLEFDMFAVDELYDDTRAYPLACYESAGSVANVKHGSFTDSDDNKQFTSSYEQTMALSPVIKFKTKVFGDDSVSLVSKIKHANDEISYIKMTDVDIGGIGRGYFKPYSYSEAAFHLNNIIAPQRTLKFMDTCQQTTITNVSLYGEYADVISNVGETVRVKVDFSQPVQLSLPNFVTGSDFHYITLRVGERLVTAYADAMITDTLSDEQIDAGYVSGLVFAFSVDADMYAEQGIRYDEGDAVFLDPRFASVSDKVFSEKLPTFAGSGLADNNVQIIPQVAAPRLIALQLDKSEALRVSNEDVLPGSERVNGLAGEGALWAPGAVSSVQGEAVIDVAPVSTENNVLSYIATFSAAVGELGADDFTLMMYDDVAPIADILAVTPLQLTGAATRSGNMYVDTYRVMVGNFRGTGIAKLVMSTEASFYAQTGDRQVAGVVDNTANMAFADISGEALRYNESTAVPKLGEVVRSSTFFANGVPQEIEYTLNTGLLTFTPIADNFSVQLYDRSGQLREDLSDMINIRVRAGKPPFRNEAFSSFFFVTLDLSALAYSEVDFGEVSLSLNSDDTLALMTKWGQTTTVAVTNKLDISAPYVSNLQLHDYNAAAMTVKLSTSDGVYIRDIDDLLACCVAQTSAGETLALSSVSSLNEGTEFLIKVDTSSVQHGDIVTVDLKTSAFPLQGSNGVGVGDTQLSLREVLAPVTLTMDNQGPVMTSEARFTNDGASLILFFDEPVTGYFPASSWLSLTNAEPLLIEEVVASEDGMRYDVSFTLPMNADSKRIQIDYEALRFQDDFANVADMGAISHTDNICLPNIITYGLDDAALVTIEEGEAVQANMEVKLSCAPTGEVHVGWGAVTNNKRLAFYAAPFDGSQMSSLVFTPDNWNEPQKVSIAAPSNGYLEPSLVSTEYLSVTKLVNETTGYQLTPDAPLNVKFLDSDYWFESYIQEEYDAMELFTVSGPGVSAIPTSLNVTFNRFDSDFFKDKRWVNPNATVLSIEKEELDVTFSGKSPRVDSPPQWIERVELLNSVGHVIAWFNIKIDPSGIAFTKTQQKLVEGQDTSTVEVVLTAPPQDTLRLNLQSLDTSEIAINKDELVFTPDNWNIAQTFIVNAVEDFEQDGDITAHVQLSVAGDENNGIYGEFNAEKISFTIIQSPLSSLNIVYAQDQVANENGGKITMTVSLNARPDNEQQYVYVNNNGGVASISATSPQYSQIIFTQDNWDVPQQITLTIVDDEFVPEERFRIRNGSISVRSTEKDTEQDNITNTSLIFKIKDDDYWPSPDVKLINHSRLVESLKHIRSELLYRGNYFTDLMIFQTGLDYTTSGNVIIQLNGDVACRFGVYSNSARLSFDHGESTSEDAFYYEFETQHNPYASSSEARQVNIPIKLINDNVINYRNYELMTIKCLEGDPSWEGFEKTVKVTARDDEINYIVDKNIGDDYQLMEGITEKINVSLSDGVYGTELDGGRYYISEVPSILNLSATDERVGLRPNTYEINDTIKYSTDSSVPISIHFDSMGLSTDGIDLDSNEIIFTPDNWNVPQVITLSSPQIGELSEGGVYGIKLYVVSDSINTNSDYLNISSDVIEVSVSDTAWIIDGEEAIPSSQRDNPGINVSNTRISLWSEGEDTFTVSLATMPSENITIKLIELGEKVEVILSSPGKPSHDGPLYVEPRILTFWANGRPSISNKKFAVIENSLFSADLQRLNVNEIRINDAKYDALFDIDNGIIKAKRAFDYESDERTFEIAVTLVNKVGVEVTETIKIDLLNTNESPIARMIPHQDIYLGKPYYLDLRQYFSDVDEGDELTYELIGGLPNGIKHEDGILSGQLDISDSSKYTSAFPKEIVVSVRDKGNAVSSQTFTLSIINPNVVPALIVSAATGSTSEDGGSASFTVRLDSQPDGVVILLNNSLDTSELQVMPMTLTFTPDNWSVAQTVKVIGVDDDEVDGDITAAVLISVDTNGVSDTTGYLNIEMQSIEVTNTDNDNVLPAFIVDKQSGVTSEDGGSFTFTLRLSTPPSMYVSAEFMVSAAGEARISPFMVDFTPDNWSIPQEVTVTGLDDDEVDGDINYTVTISANSISDAEYQDVTAQINAVNTDND